MLSLPHWGWTFWLGMKLPLLPKFDLFWKMTGVLKHPPGGEHFWEIGKRGYPAKRIVEDLGACGLEVLRNYRAAENPYHRFLVCRKLPPA